MPPGGKIRPSGSVISAASHSPQRSGQVQSSFRRISCDRIRAGASVRLAPFETKDPRACGNVVLAQAHLSGIAATPRPGMF